MKVNINFPFQLLTSINVSYNLNNKKKTINGTLN